MLRVVAELSRIRMTTFPVHCRQRRDAEVDALAAVHDDMRPS